MTGRDPADDSGSIIVATLLFFVIALLLVMGVSAASVAFVEQRNLASVCDAAAVAATTRADLAAIYANGVGPAGQAVDEPAARSVVAEVITASYPDAGQPASATVSTNGTVVTVLCRATVQVPFGAAFGHGDGLERVAVARARLPAREA